MPRLRLSKTAQADMNEIWAFIAQDSIRAAEKVTEDLMKVCKMLAANPKAGRQRLDISPELRSFPRGNYLIFYMLLPDQLRVVRIVHGRRDVSEIV